MISGWSLPSGLIEENMIFKVTLQQLVNASYITSVCSSLIPECLHDVLNIFRCWMEPSITWVIMTSASLPVSYFNNDVIGLLIQNSEISYERHKLSIYMISSLLGLFTNDVPSVQKVFADYDSFSSIFCHKTE